MGPVGGARNGLAFASFVPTLKPATNAAPTNKCCFILGFPKDTAKKFTTTLVQE